jgi:hypothetical protein
MFDANRYVHCSTRDSRESTTATAASASTARTSNNHNKIAERHGEQGL